MALTVLQDRFRDWGPVVYTQTHTHTLSRTRTHKTSPKSQLHVFRQRWKPPITQPWTRRVTSPSRTEPLWPPPHTSHGHVMSARLQHENNNRLILESSASLCDRCGSLICGERQSVCNEENPIFMLWKEAGAWLVNSHTPLTVINESDWSTVIHISAVLQPDWLTEVTSLQSTSMEKLQTVKKIRGWTKENCETRQNRSPCWKTKNSRTSRLWHRTEPPPGNLTSPSLQTVSLWEKCSVTEEKAFKTSTIPLLRALNVRNNVLFPPPKRFTKRKMQIH